LGTGSPFRKDENDQSNEDEFLEQINPLDFKVSENRLHPESGVENVSKKTCVFSDTNSSGGSGFPGASD
jgi:hypothetical protein